MFAQLADENKELSGERALLVGVWETSANAYSSEEDFDHSLDELHELAVACLMKPVGRVTQQMPRAGIAFYVGRGKLEEIKERAAYLEATLVLFNDTLSPSQIRNLQGELKLPVMDRTSLILDIFRRRARTREARLQVDLARLQYLKPRLMGLWETQNRQGGASGAMSSKGEGETQLEIDRRLIDHRLTELRQALKDVVRERENQRKKRRAAGIPLVALVGYTNAGKSTIMNAFVKLYSKEEKKVFEADMLFATLDTTVRRIAVSGGRSFLLSDTVGFIHKLPTGLVEAFKSTLEEVMEADLLLQVVDASDRHHTEHMQVTRQTIAELGGGHIPMITVYNKADLHTPAIAYPAHGLTRRDEAGGKEESIYISAKDEDSLRMLAELIAEKLYGDDIEAQFLLPYEKGAIASGLSEHASVLEREYLPEGLRLRVRCGRELARKYRAYLLPGENDGNADL